MLDEQPIGKALSRDISSARGEEELDRFIARRARGEATLPKHEEEFWFESERRAKEAQEQRLRGEWTLYHLDRAAALKKTMEELIRHHEKQAQKVSQPKGAA